MGASINESLLERARSLIYNSILGRKIGEYLVAANGQVAG
jgi:hypothetical protein